MSSIVPRPLKTPERGAQSHPTSVYRYYDRRGVLIYVGITKQGIGRNHQHNNHADWWRYAARQEVEHYDDRPTAAAREKELIRQYRPPFNKQHNIEWRDLRVAYLAWAAVDERDESLLAAYQRIGRLLALDIVSLNGPHLNLRTRLDHAVFVPHLAIGPEGAQVHGGGSKCRVASLQVAGNFALIHIVLRRPIIEIGEAFASVRWRQSTSTSREHVQLRSVSITVVKDAV